MAFSSCCGSDEYRRDRSIGAAADDDGRDDDDDEDEEGKGAKDDGGGCESKVEWRSEVSADWAVDMASAMVDGRETRTKVRIVEVRPRV